MPVEIIRDTNPVAPPIGRTAIPAVGFCEEPSGSLLRSFDFTELKEEPVPRRRNVAALIKIFQDLPEGHSIVDDEPEYYGDLFSVLSRFRNHFDNYLDTRDRKRLAVEDYKEIRSLWEDDNLPSDKHEAVAGIMLALAMPAIETGVRAVIKYVPEGAIGDEGIIDQLLTVEEQKQLVRAETLLVTMAKKPNIPDTADSNETALILNRIEKNLNDKLGVLGKEENSSPDATLRRIKLILGRFEGSDPMWLLRVVGVDWDKAVMDGLVIYLLGNTPFRQIHRKVAGRMSLSAIQSSVVDNFKVSPKWVLRGGRHRQIALGLAVGKNTKTIATELGIDEEIVIDFAESYPQFSHPHPQPPSGHISYTWLHFFAKNLGENQRQSLARTLSKAGYQLPEYSARDSSFAVETETGVEASGLILERSEETLLTEFILERILSRNEETIGLGETDVLRFRMDRETLEEVGEKFGLTRERVRRIESEALGLYKILLGKKGLSYPPDLEAVIDL